MPSGFLLDQYLFCSNIFLVGVDMFRIKTAIITNSEKTMQDKPNPPKEQSTSGVPEEKSSIDE